jgi:hypothetical protein
MLYPARVPGQGDEWRLKSHSLCTPKGGILFTFHKGIVSWPSPQTWAHPEKVLLQIHTERLLKTYEYVRPDNFQGPCNSSFPEVHRKSTQLCCSGEVEEMELKPNRIALHQFNVIIFPAVLLSSVEGTELIRA